jgi:hypothetical protein
LAIGRQGRLDTQNAQQQQIDNARQERVMQMQEDQYGLQRQQFEAQQQAAQQQMQQQDIQRAAAVGRQALRLGEQNEGLARQFLKRSVPVYQKSISAVADDYSDLVDDNVPWEQLKSHLQSLAAFDQQGDEAYTLKPGEARFVGNRQVASLPGTAEGQNGFTLAPGQTRYGPDGKPIASVPMRSTPADTQNIASGLRGEFNKASQEFLGVANSYQRIRDSASDPSAAGDLALIFNYMKVLDPGSTVREGEFATAQNATGVPGRVVSLYNSIINGQRLNTEQRADFVNRADRLYKGQENRFRSNVVDRYTTLARRAGVDPMDVIHDFGVGEITATGPGGLAVVNSPEDAARLPPGTRFRTPDGQVRVRH